MIVNLADLKARDAKKPRLHYVPSRGQQLSASCRPASEPAWACAPERDEWDYTKTRPTAFAAAFSQFYTRTRQCAAAAVPDRCHVRM